MTLSRNCFRSLFTGARIGAWSVLVRLLALGVLLVCLSAVSPAVEIGITGITINQPTSMCFGQTLPYDIEVDYGCFDGYQVIGWPTTAILYPLDGKYWSTGFVGAQSYCFHKWSSPPYLTDLHHDDCVGSFTNLPPGAYVLTLMLVPDPWGEDVEYFRPGGGMNSYSSETGTDSGYGNNLLDESAWWGSWGTLNLNVTGEPWYVGGPDYPGPAGTPDPKDGDPVNLATGEEEHSPGPDLTVSNPVGPSVAFARAYHSVNAKINPQQPFADFPIVTPAQCSVGLTPGWTHNYDYYVQGPDAQGNFTLVAPAGTYERLTPEYDSTGTPTGTFTCPADAPHAVTGVPGTNGAWQSITMMNPDGENWTFLPGTGTGIYPLSQITDALGRSVTLTWNAQRALTAIASGSNTLLSLLYQSNGQLASITDNAGRTVSYTYAGGSLTQVSQLNSANPRWQYSYTQFKGNPLLHTVQWPNPSNPTGPASMLTWAWDVSANGTKGSGRVKAQTAANGAVSTYTQTNDHTRVDITDASNTPLTSRTVYYDGLGRETGEYDAAGHWASMNCGDPTYPYKRTSVTARDGKTTHYSYTQYGKLAGVTDPRGVTTALSYAYGAWPLGQVTCAQQGGRRPVTLSYVQPSFVTTPTPGLVKTVTAPTPDGGNGTTTYTYDFEQSSTQRYGQVVQVDRPGNATAPTVTDTYQFTYVTPGLPASITDKHGRTTQVSYDARGNVTTVIDPDGRQTDLAYNIADQPTLVTLPATPGGVRRTVAQSYQYPGGVPTLVTVTGAQGIVLQLAASYDPSGNVTTVSGGLDSAQYQYDGLNRLTKLTDAKNNTTSYLYDNVSDLKQVAYPGGQTISGHQFDSVGRVLAATDSHGTTNYTYNEPGGALTAIQHSDGSTVQLQYDGYGRLTTVSDPTGSKNYTYDNSTDVLIGESVQYAGGPGGQVSYQYNPDGSLQQLATPTGAFDYQYDADENLTTLTDPVGTQSLWTYRADDLLQTQQLGNYSLTRYQYDTLGRLAGLTNFTAKGRTLTIFSLPARNDLDNLTQLNTTRLGVPGQTGKTNYTYDAFSQLTQEQWTPANGDTQSQTAGFDMVGNPTTFLGTTQTFGIGNRFNGTGFAYDGNGDPTSYKGDTLAFNLDNALTSYTRASNQTSSLTAGYTADGLRAWKEVNGQKTYFLYAGETLLGELNSDGTVKCYNTWGPTGLLARTRLATAQQSGQTTWYQFDALGNVAERLSATGKVLSSDQYDAWGNLQTGGDVTDPVGYRGQFGYYTDHETGLLLCTHRYYDPVAGRWITQDPIGYCAGMNLYAYCGGDPLNLIDSSGLWAWGNTIGIIKAVGGGLETISGVGLAGATGVSGVGLIAGGAVALHGADIAASGFRQALSGNEIDSLTSQGLQKLGMSKGTANSVDTGISIVGSIGTGIGTAATKIGNIAAIDPLASGMSKWTIINTWETGSKALPTPVFKQLGGEATSPLYKAPFIKLGSMMGPLNPAIGPVVPLSTNGPILGLFPWTATGLIGTGLTPWGNIGFGGISGVINGVAGGCNGGCP